MRYLLLTLIAIFLLFLGSNCKKEALPRPCTKIWQKNFLSSVKSDTTNGLTLLIPDNTITGNNAVLLIDSIEGDFRASLELKDIHIGDRNGAYFRMVASNDSAGKTRQVIAGWNTHSDTLEGLQLATIINSSGNTPDGEFSNYQKSFTPVNFRIDISRQRNYVYCTVTATKTYNKNVYITQTNSAFFNTDMCNISLELGSNSNTAIRDSVGVTLTHFSLSGHSIPSKTDYFNCNSIK